MTDPSNYVTNPPSTIVKVVNTAREDMNGQLGVVVLYNTERGRYIVHLTASATQNTMALKPENLVKANTFETYKAQYQQLRNDPRVRQELSKYYQQVQERLPSFMKPEHAALAVMLLLSFFMYFVGFTKVIMTISLLLLLATIAAPDLVSASNAGGTVSSTAQAVARNFPTRCRETLEQSIPAARGRISNRIALGIVIFFVLVIGKSLLTPSKPRRAAPRAPATDGGVPSTPRSSLGDVNSKSGALEDAYKIGFNDATAGKSYGASLNLLDDVQQQSPVMDRSAPRALGVEDTGNLNYEDYAPPPPTKSGGFGFSTIMSLVYIGRTMYELGKDEGGFDVQRLVMNVRTLEVWKLGLLGFSVYNVVRAFV